MSETDDRGEENERSTGTKRNESASTASVPLPDDRLRGSGQRLRLEAGAG